NSPGSVLGDRNPDAEAQQSIAHGDDVGTQHAKPHAAAEPAHPDACARGGSVGGIGYTHPNGRQPGPKWRSDPYPNHRPADQYAWSPLTLASIYSPRALPGVPAPFERMGSDRSDGRCARWPRAGSLNQMSIAWLTLLPVAGLGWWALGFPPG